jgi:hypothetical protein
MARRHGRAGRLYMNITSGGTAEPIAFLRSWSIDFATDRVDVTALGDTNKVYVAGLPDAQGQFAGFFDDATTQMYTAATDGVARKFYLYPDRDNASGVYWFGTALFDFSVAGGTEQAVEVSGSFAAASAVAKVG